MNRSERFEAEIPARIKAALSDFRARLTASYGGDFVGLRLFGSYARGEQHPESDVDVLILLAKEGLEQNAIFDSAAAVDVAHQLWISSLILSVQKYESMLADEVGIALSIEEEGLVF